MNENETENQSNSDSQLESAIWSVLAQPLDDEAIDRVKLRAKNLATENSEVNGLEAESNSDQESDSKNVQGGATII